MKITENKEVTTIKHQKIVIGRKCDICGKDILPVKTCQSVQQIVDGQSGEYNYFTFETWHHDWSEDSFESLEGGDACSIECMTKFFNFYIKNMHDHPINSKEIQIKHVRSLEAGSDQDRYYDDEWDTYCRMERLKENSIVHDYKEEIKKREERCASCGLNESDVCCLYHWPIRLIVNCERT